METVSFYISLGQNSIERQKNISLSFSITFLFVNVIYIQLEFLSVMERFDASAQLLHCNLQTPAIVNTTKPFSTEKLSPNLSICILQNHKACI